MISPSSEPSPKIPRLDSLLHQLQHAKDADGQPIPLLDELLFFLDDPPPGTADRWQKGAELCQGHGIKTSRMSVWRLYRAHILQWRREQNPAPPAPPPDPDEIARLRDHARHLAVQRTLETLNDPRLSPGHLIGLIQNDNQSQQINSPATSSTTVSPSGVNSNDGSSFSASITKSVTNASFPTR
jgi:hypothetical protein